MQDASLNFLKTLLQTPSPSGFERPIQDVVRAWTQPLAHEVRTDRHGNVIAALNPEGKPRIMLAGHCDQIGLMVQHVDDCGFLYVQPIGGWDMQILLGQNLTVWTKSGPVLFRGPNINPHVLDRLRGSAQAHEIAVQVRGAPRATGTDANAIQLSRDGVATGLVGIPNRYMHSPVEVVCLDDLERAARLLAEFCARVTPQQDWIP